VSKINFLLFSVILNIIFLAVIILMFYFLIWKKRKRKTGPDYVWVGEGADPFTGKKENIWKK
jgi:heme/copper-type cytochrome/quinol oxidase subunit 2